MLYGLYYYCSTAKEFGLQDQHQHNADMISVYVFTVQHNLIIRNHTRIVGEFYHDDVRKSENIYIYIYIYIYTLIHMIINIPYCFSSFIFRHTL